MACEAVSRVMAREDDCRRLFNVARCCSDTGGGASSNSCEDVSCRVGRKEEWRRGGRDAGAGAPSTAVAGETSENVLLLLCKFRCNDKAADGSI